MYKSFGRHIFSFLLRKDVGMGFLGQKCMFNFLGKQAKQWVSPVAQR